MKKTQIITVQASAGSGKTYNLAKKYLYLLLKSDVNITIKSIVAVTFTNKAAVEMKFRILNFLKRAALLLDTGDFFDDLNFSKEELSKKSISALNTIFNLYDNFNISTIDSFKNRILRVCAINLGISPYFVIQQDYSTNLLLSLRMFLQKFNKSKKIKRIISKYLSQYLMNVSAWIPRNDIYNEIEKIFSKSGDIGKDLFICTKNNYYNEFLSRVKKILKKVKNFAKYLPTLQIYSYYNKAVINVLDEGIKSFLSIKVPSVFSKKLKYKKREKINCKADKIWNEINKEIGYLYDFYVENYYNIYSRMYTEIMTEFERESNKKGVVFLNEINKKTIIFFKKKNDIMPEVYCKLSEKYRHFLIDEFQDTSFIQWAGIKRFLEESLSSEGTFFCVGDIKQAIYDFRGGSPELFDLIPYEFPSSKIKKKYLKYNFRSGANIVNFNNNIFSVENIKRFLIEIYGKNIEYADYDFSKFSKTYASSLQKAIIGHDYGYVEIKTIDTVYSDATSMKQDIKQKFMSYIYQLVKRFDHKDIAVLCRTNEEVIMVSSWLLDNGFEIESSQTLSIKNNNIIKQIISLLMFINSPIDNLSFCSFILGEIFSRVSHIKISEIEKFIFRCNKKNKTRIISEIFKIKYKYLWEKYFQEFFAKISFASAYELTLLIIEKFNVVENFHNDKAFIMCLLEFIKEFEMQNLGIRTFLEFFDKLNNDDSSLNIKSDFGNGIKIMTIHKAKGLQFPVVIMPFLKPLEKKIDSPYFDNSGSKIKLLNISKKVIQFSPKAKKIYNNEKLNMLLTELNVLYVSMTRAKFEFYAIIPQKTGVAKNIFSILFKNKKLISGTKRNYNFNNKKKDNFITDVFYSGYKNIQKYLINTQKEKIDINNKAIKGTVIHYALSKIISLRNKNICENINNVVKLTKRKFPYENTEFVEENLTKLFSSIKILNFFMYREDKIYNEKEIINRHGQSFVIDKLIFDENHIIIVDFKSSNYREEKNKIQLKNYSKLIFEMYPYKNVLSYIVDVQKIQCFLLS
ncbi:MAG: UvrD-helicase domain-containing protein [Endomicrobium sp.]|jgi:ATP-dependent exoDNAse (exonuclease V) beta subunit|nr:UvrD-helicase domain-containing protein [Endomicrobium sp.]